MDEFRVVIHPKDFLDYDRNRWVAQLCINGEIVKDDDYCLDIDSFFSAMDRDGAVVSLLGSCFDPGCCGEGYCTFPTEQCWNWGWNEVEFRLSWSDVYKAAKQIIAEIEKSDLKSHECYLEMYQRLPFYREKLDGVKKRMDSQSSTQDKT